MSFDKNKFYLGKICKRGHSHDDTNKSLRYIKYGGCVICNRKRSETQRELCDMKPYFSVYYLKNKDKLLDNAKTRYLNKTQEIKEYQKLYYQENRQYVYNRQKEYEENHKEELDAYRKQYRMDNNEKIVSYGKKYRKNNKEKRNAFEKNKKLTDINYAIACNMRTRLWQAMKNNQKSGHTIELLGCSIDELKAWLEDFFTDDMNWGEYLNGNIHIDHILPVSAFELKNSEEQEVCFHYTNVQPLWAKDNLEKSYKII